MTVLDVDKVVAVTWNKKLKRIEFLVKERGQCEKYSWVYHQSLPDHVIPLKFKQIVFEWTQRINEFNEDSSGKEDQEEGEEDVDDDEEDEEQEEDTAEDDEEVMDDGHDEGKNNHVSQVKSEERVSINHEDLNNNFFGNSPGINSSP